MLTVAGFQVPVIPLLDVAGKAGTASPLHIVREVPNVNTGVVFGVTVTVNVVVTAQYPAAGVKV